MITTAIVGILSSVALPNYLNQVNRSRQNEAAAMYGVSSIPMSFLLDENGIIVAKDLRGFDLHLNIDKHVKSLR